MRSSIPQQPLQQLQPPPPPLQEPQQPFRGTCLSTVEPITQLHLVTTTTTTTTTRPVVQRTWRLLHFLLISSWTIALPSRCTLRWVSSWTVPSPSSPRTRYVVGAFPTTTTSIRKDNGSSCCTRGTKPRKNHFVSLHRNSHNCCCNFSDESSSIYDVIIFIITYTSCVFLRMGRIIMI